VQETDNIKFSQDSQNFELRGYLDYFRGDIEFNLNVEENNFPIGNLHPSLPRLRRRVRVEVMLHYTLCLYR
jgi:hypothetical protein